VTGEREQVDIAPTVARGLVFAGTSAQIPGGVGSVLALDALGLALAARPREPLQPARAAEAS